ncbi:MAG: hypothetical protein ACTHLN_06515 [Tepidisphaeraceae bacterium]
MSADAETEKETLQGYQPSLGNDDELYDAIEKAFDYRGDITVTLRDGSLIEGYLFDRHVNRETLGQSQIRIMPTKAAGMTKVLYQDIAELKFTGKDTAAGKSFETWVRKYHEKKAAGEKNIGIEPEALD